MDHYKVLEIGSQATQAEIRIAYKRLAKKYHPDINPSPHAHTLFQQISESYRVLSDTDQRSRYDASRRSSYSQPQTPPEQTRSGRQTTHRRNPQSYRSRPPQRQEDLIRPYMKYAYTVSWIGFFLAILLLLDFVAPNKVEQETIPESYVLPGAPFQAEYGRPQLIYTAEGTRMEVRAGKETIVLTSGIAEVEKSLLFNFPRQINVQNGVSLKPLVLLYAHLSFFPILLFVFSFIGSFIRREILFDFNVCLVTGVLIVITLVMIVTTT